MEVHPLLKKCVYPLQIFYYYVNGGNNQDSVNQLKLKKISIVLILGEVIYLLILMYVHQLEVIVLIMIVPKDVQLV